jgi:hypothetical protein
MFFVKVQKQGFSAWALECFRINVFRARILKLLWIPGIDSKEPIPPAYVAWWAGNSIPSRFLAPIDCLKIPAQNCACKSSNWFKTGVFDVSLKN